MNLYIRNLVYIFFAFSVIWGIRAQSSITLSPIFSVPVGESATDFNAGIGAEIIGSSNKDTLGAFTNWLPESISPIAGFTFFSNSLKARNTSGLSIFQLWTGVHWRLPVQGFLEILPRIGFGGFYGRFSMAGRDDSFSIINPFAQVGISFRVPVANRISLEANQVFNIHFVGQPSTVSQMNLSMGIHYALGGGFSAQLDDPVAGLKNSILSNYKNKNYTKASREIDALERIAPDDLMIDKFRSLIYQQQNLINAREQIEAGREYRALSILNTIDSIEEAQKEAQELRAKLSSQIEYLLKSGIAAYQKADYDVCIQNMEKILLIEPGHETATIYLPRAVNRRNALKKLGK
ncbi:MAG: hypothetical protein KDK38_00745 [Leptospiraceae bacterium]|nr:hypothetical protein [Leptospiraceae bacterium]